MSRKVFLSADSTCDLTPKQKERFKVTTCPLHIILGRTSYDDGVNITPDEIFQNFKATGVLPKTSAINVQEYVDAFTPLIEQGYDIVHINLGSSISASYKNCCTAAQQLGHVYPVDSGNITTAMGLLVIEAAELIEQGMSAEEVAAKVTALKPKVHGSFILDRLDYLRAGGRCSTVAMLGANLLGLKPCIEVNSADASMIVGKKYRGRFEKVMLQYIDDKLAEFDNINTKRAFITNAGVSQDRISLALNHLESKKIFDEILISQAGCTISSHCGPGTFAFLFMTN